MANTNGSGIRGTVLLAVCVYLVDAVNSLSYEFGEDCYTAYGNIKEDTQIYIRYDGKRVSPSCDYFSFEPLESEEVGIERKVCVKTINYTDPDCSVQLNIQSTYFGSRLHTITCNTGTNTPFCGEEKNDLYIFFKERGLATAYKANFVLLVYVQRVDNSEIVWGVIGGLLGAIVLFTACAAIVFWCVCKRKPARGRVLNPNQPNAGTATNLPAYPYASYSTQAGNPVTNLYPVGNYPTQPHSQHQYQPQPQPQPPSYQEPEKVPSAPPPSYDQLN